MMKKIIKTIALCVVLGMILVIFAACAPTADEIVGGYAYYGNGYSIGIVLHEDGTYTKFEMDRYGEITSTIVGEYEIKGRKIRLHTPDTADPETILKYGSWVDYNYSDGVLENAGYEYKKTT